MTISEMIQSTKEMLTAADIAPILGSDQYDIVLQARQDKREGVDNLGFPTVVIGTHVKIPRRAFLAFMGVKVEEEE